MNAQVDVPNPGSSKVAISARPEATQHETAPATDDQICWVEIKQYPYQPDHQVELLHLQAEADALLLQLQTLSQKRLIAQGAGESR
ncbi:MAG: hypothetical protein ICV62_11790 [Cyanobacteria bacterium Co-bin13]|nr:hypothetical protein [Cyanobacteria bacterium Co-bin13]